MKIPYMRNEWSQFGKQKKVIFLEHEVTEAAIKKGARLCYMDNSIDEPMSAWDHCKEPEDFDAFDWKEEVAKLSETQRLALFHSPLGAEAEKEDVKDSVDSQIYEADD